MNSISDVWQSVLSRLQEQLSETTIRTWFDEVDVVTMEDSAFVLHCSNSFKKSTIETRFMKHIKAALKDIFSSDLEVKILNDEQLAAYHGVAPDQPGSLLDSDAFTFETYVVGPQNKLAYAAARAVADKPAENFNPLFIYGDSGLGKTHLLYAIAHQVKRKREDLRIVYIKGDDFTNELIASIREGSNAEFREKYRQAGILLVDDIQFIAGKKQTRVAIVKNKAAMLGVKLPDEIYGYIAENVTANVRQIEGTLNKLLAYRDLLGDQVDEQSVGRAVRDMLQKSNEYIPSPSVIISYICKYFSVEEDVLRGQRRGRNEVNARQIAMYLIRRMTNLSLNDIGKEFGDRDHTTVLHSLDKVEKQMRTDPAFAEVVKEITTNINAKR